ncbi:MAG: class I SAM-dependent methyltransferase [Parcubacteria group bacterium]|nr:class I SAM-dependent methyltransferase [Parcubacteria group bacterium]
MELKEYKNLAERESFFWWNVGRRRILEDALKRHVASSHLEILDVGCGPGGNILFLKKFGNVTGIDSSKEALSFAATQGFLKTVESGGEKLPFPDQSFDLVSILDVLEHMDSDEQALGEIFRVLKTEGLLLLTVPAYMWMWSEHDEALHHKRRYGYKELRKKIINAGFSIEEMSYFVIPSIPFRVLKLCVGKLKSVFSKNKDKTLKTDDVILPPFLNSLFIVWLTVERYVMKLLPLPFGSSLLVVAEKPL